MPKPKTVSKKKAKRENQEEVDFSPKQSLLELKFKDKKFNFSEKQQAILGTALSKDTKIVFLSGPSGTGKAQPVSEPVLTPDGWKPIGEIKVGDFVYSVDGSKTKVLGVFPQGLKKVLSLTMSDGAETKCCEDHLWLTSDRHQRNIYQRATVDGKRKKMYKLPERFTVKDAKSIMGSLKKAKGELNHMIPIISSPIRFEKKENLPIDPYIMGQLLGDGSFRMTPIHITTSDQETVDLMKNEYGGDFKHLSKYDYRIKGLREIIQSFGLYKLYSHEKFIPCDYKYGSIEDRLSILQGLFDSDGTATRLGACVFSSTSQKLTNDVIEIVNSLGGIAYKKSRVGKLYGVEHKMSHQLHINLPKEYCPFRLERKKARYKPNTKYSPKRYVESAEECGKEECVCIAVEHPSHLYVTKDYIVTHNTHLAIYSALNIINRDKDKGICYVRSVVESASSHMGFLPGTEDDKINPYMRPLEDKLHEILKPDSVSNLGTAGLLETRPINFLRGNQFDNQIVILDEGQNLTKKEMITFLTRIGRNCIMFICGDSDQSDIRDSAAFYDTISRFDKHEKSKDFGIYHFAFTIDDVVRNPIIKHILRVMS